MHLVYHSGISPEHQFFSVEPQLSFIEAWHKNQSYQFLANLKESDGWFNPACFLHHEFWPDLPLINGTTYVEAFGKWFFSQEVVRIQDDSGVFSGLCPPPNAELIIWPTFPN